MKLDIGSAEGPDDSADIHLDYTTKSGFTKQMLGYRPIDIVADAHYLPFRNNVFDEVFAGRVLLGCTGRRALKETIRVTKKNGRIKITQHLPIVPKTLLLLNWYRCSIVNIEALNWTSEEEGNEVFDVTIEAINGTTMYSWGIWSDKEPEYEEVFYT